MPRLMMRLRGIFFLILLLTLSAFTVSAQTVLSGVLKNYPDRTIYVYQTEDELSAVRTMISKVNTDGAGKFKLELSTTEITRYFLMIGSTEGIFYAHPGRNYTLTAFPTPNNNDFQRFDKTTVPLSFDDLEKDDSNLLIPKFNSDLYAFLDEHFYDFAVEKYRGSKAVKAQLKGTVGNDLAPMPADGVKKEEEVIDSVGFTNWVENFRLQMVDKYEVGFTNVYFSNYYRYTIAELELMAGVSSKTLYQEYLMSQPVLVRHPAYMKFFTAYYDRCLEGRKRVVDTSILRAVNVENDPSRLVEILMKDSAFFSQSVGQLAVLNGLKGLLQNSDYPKAAVKQTMKKMSEQPQCNTYKDIANRLVAAQDRQKAGYVLEDFTLLTPKLEKWESTSSLNGYTYIFFFADWCTPCKKEMLLLSKFQETYGKDIQFIAISVDDNIDAMKAHMQSNRNQNFTFLYGGNNPELREIFNLRAIPHSILLDANGAYMFDYTRKPSEGIQMDFDKIVALLRQPKGGKTWKD